MDKNLPLISVTYLMAVYKVMGSLFIHYHAKVTPCLGLERMQWLQLFLGSTDIILLDFYEIDKLPCYIKLFSFFLTLITCEQIIIPTVDL